MGFLEIFERSGLVAAHRGDRSNAPENTLSALISSIGKCDFIEIDVVLSRDGTPYVIHDDTLTRTTDARERFPARSPWRVTAFRLDELKRLDFGNWFDGKSEPLLTLEEALRFIVEHRLFLNIEIKAMKSVFDDENVVERVLEVIDRCDAAPYLLISSFEHAYLQIVKDKRADIPTAALLESPREDLLDYLATLDVDAVHLSDAMSDEATVRMLRAAGYFVNVYTVNEIPRREALFGWGVNGVFTDTL